MIGQITNDNSESGFSGYRIEKERKVELLGYPVAPISPKLCPLRSIALDDPNLDLDWSQR